MNAFTATFSSNKRRHWLEIGAGLLHNQLPHLLNAAPFAISARVRGIRRSAVY